MALSIRLALLLLVVVVMGGVIPAAGVWGQGGVYLDESLTAGELIESAKVLAGEGRTADAVAALDQIVTEHSNKLLPAGDQVYVDAQLRVRQIIASDDGLLRAYREQKDASAWRALGLALADGPDVVALERVLNRYHLTRPGLDAALALAGIYLERGNAAAAASVLGEVATHPDADARAMDWHRLLAVAGAIAGDRAGFEAHRAALAAADETGLGKLDAMAAALLAADVPERAGGSDDTTLSQRITPLWRYVVSELSESPGEQIAGNPRTPAHISPKAGLPVVAGFTVLINTGAEVRAIDRDSGRPLWRYGEDDRKEEKLDQEVQLLRMRLGNIMQNESRGVAIAGKRAFAVTGLRGMTYARLPSQPKVANRSLLSSIDLEDGRLSWSISPSELQEKGFAQAHFQGTPIVESGRVYALINRSQGSNAADTFLTCLDADTGRVLWTRHISGRRIVRRGMYGIPPTMRVRDGRAYVCDNDSAVVCVDVRTGSIRWARLMERAAPTSDINPRFVRHSAQPLLHTPQPVLVRAGLIVPIGPNEDRAALLDPETGDIRKSLNREVPERAQWLAYQGDALAVGARIVRFSGDDLKVRWSTDFSGGEAEHPSGHAVVAGDTLAVPAATKVTVFSLADGKQTRAMPSLQAGNLAWGGGMLISAQPQYVYGIDDWSRASRRLVERAAAHPTDPGPGLSLAYLALRLSKDDAVLKGVDLALIALDERATAGQADGEDNAQAKVFGQLLAYTRAAYGGSSDLRAQVFDRIASITAGPADEVAYHLARGAYLAEPQVADYELAIEHYQSVLTSKDLAAQVYTQEGVRRHAGLEARRRIERLIRERGPQVYGRFEALAAAEFQQLLANGATPRRMIDLAMRFPLSKAAARAHYQAGVMLIAMQDAGGAVSQLRLAFEHAGDRALRSAAASRLAKFYQDIGLAGKAVRWLERVSREYPGLPLRRDDQPISAKAWLAELEGLPGTHALLPRLGTRLETPVRLPGRLVPFVGSQPRAASDRFLCQEGKTLRFYATVDQPPLWERDIEAEDVIALSADRDQVLLWSDTRSELVSLNGRTGQPDWPTLHAAALLEEVTEADRLPGDSNRADQDLLNRLKPQANRRAAVVRAQQPEAPAPLAVPRGPEFTVRAGESVVCLADYAGRVVGIDRHTGSVIWHLRSPIDELHNMTLGPDALALSGRTRAAGIEHAGRLLVVDLITGEPCMPTAHIDQSLPRWAVFAGKSKLIIQNGSEFVAYDLVKGNIAWRIDQAALRLTGGGWSGDKVLVLQDNNGRALLVDPDTGKVRQSTSAESDRRAAHLSVQVLDDSAYLLSSRAAVVASIDEGTRWRDAVAPDWRSFLGQFIGQDRIALLAQAASYPADDQTDAAYRVFVIDRAGGQLLSEYDLAGYTGAIDPDGSILVDGSLILSTDQGVIVIPTRE